MKWLLDTSLSLAVIVDCAGDVAVPELLAILAVFEDHQSRAVAAIVESTALPLYAGTVTTSDKLVGVLHSCCRQHMIDVIIGLAKAYLCISCSTCRFECSARGNCRARFKCWQMVVNLQNTKG